MSGLDELTEVDKVELASLVELAEEMTVPLVTMRRWADADRRNGFPRPVKHFGRIGLFVRADVEDWCAWKRKTQ